MDSAKSHPAESVFSRRGRPYARARYCRQDISRLGRNKLPFPYWSYFSWNLKIAPRIQSWWLKTLRTCRRPWVSTHNSYKCRYLQVCGDHAPLCDSVGKTDSSGTVYKMSLAFHVFCRISTNAEFPWPDFDVDTIVWAILSLGGAKDLIAKEKLGGIQAQLLNRPW